MQGSPDISNSGSSKGIFKDGFPQLQQLEFMCSYQTTSYVVLKLVGSEKPMKVVLRGPWIW